MSKTKSSKTAPDKAKRSRTSDQDQIQSAEPRLSDTVSYDTPTSVSLTLLPLEALVLYSLLAGKEKAKIAQELGVDETAVKEHIKSILRRVRKIKDADPNKSDNARGSKR